MAVDGGYPKKSDMAGATLEGKREAILDRLTEAFAADRIHMEEYESRVAIAQNAHSDSELAGALSGLDASKTESLGSPSAGWMSNRIDAHMSGSSSIACVMGERRLAGDWLSGDRVGSFTFMGSTRLDLLATALPAGRLKIDAFIFMGELQVVVPRGLPVRMNAFPFMGDARVDRDVNQRIEAGKPYVEIDGFAMMGSLRVMLGE
ncbi:MAG: DUF1707 domain-containing protein [Rectinemataceae bacterium]